MAGVQVSDGTIVKKQTFRVLRNNEVLAEDLKASSLKIVKENAKEVKKGLECGLALEDFHDIEPNDVIVCYEIKEVPKHFKVERVEIQDYEVKDK